tara:strand:- start:22 stop:249 length:228 start_codon:yes stop_codon:yes gene_type:complete
LPKIKGLVSFFIFFYLLGYHQFIAVNARFCLAYQEDGKSFGGNISFFPSSYCDLVVLKLKYRGCQSSFEALDLLK